jgi:hypothetical protein
MTSAIFDKPSVEYIRGLTLWYQASGSDHQWPFDESRICNSTSLYYTQPQLKHRTDAASPPSCPLWLLSYPVNECTQTGAETRIELLT